jgi:ABC-type Fe3+/spermidine/putrescine transport system ATPase subunit
MTAVLELRGVTVELGARLLDEVTLSVGAGEILIVTGPSGAGKTTLLRAVLGLVAPTAGTVHIRGVPASEAGRILIPPEERNLAVVFQDLALWPHLTVHDNLAFGLASRGVSRGEREPRIREMLRLVGLGDLGKRFPGELSGGERQRVAIARALVVEPDAVLLDEPLANLDVVRKRELLGLFHELLRDRRTTAIYVTHDPREAVALGDRVAILERGRVVQAGTREELREQPTTDFACVFADEMDEIGRRQTEEG